MDASDWSDKDEGQQLSGDDVEEDASVNDADTEETPRPLRGRKRSREAVAMKEEVEAIDSKTKAADEEPEPTTRPRRSSRQRAAKPTKQRRLADGRKEQTHTNKNKNNDDDDDEAGEEIDFDPEEGTASFHTPVQKRNTTSKRKRAPQGSHEDRTCPHCQKIMTSNLGFKYHVDKRVCRPDKNQKGAKRRFRGKNKNDRTESKRFRGEVEDRTCPMCSKVFTSELGLTYHVKRNVCQLKGGSKASMNLLPALRPGAKFVTQFGVVEVIKDDRAQSSATPTKTMKVQARQYNGKRKKVAINNTKLLDWSSSHLRARRRRINTLYKNGDLREKDMFHAYYDRDPMTKSSEMQPPLRSEPIPRDPTMPEEAHPHRMVECILLPDRRPRLTPDDTQNPTEIAEAAVEGRAPTRLFLQRRLLTENYNETVLTYTCPHCGLRFANFPGMRYHVNGKVCVKKQTVEGERRLKRQKNVEDACQALLDGQSVTAYEPHQQRLLLQQRHKDKSKTRIDNSTRRRRTKPSPMYPEVLLSLGFKLIKPDMEFTDDMKLPPLRLDREERYRDSDESEADEPTALIQDLQKELRQHKSEYQRNAADQKHGSMYDAVYKSLGFKRSRSTHQDGKAVRSSKRKRKTLKPPPPPKPLPPIIDTRALADEVDSGRYPSMNRNIAENHNDFCVLCRDGGDLICCDFCNNAEHMKCIRTRFTVKDPEPRDDFMCHKCIQMMLHRRNRAEGRRIKKQERDEERQQQNASEESRRNPDIKKGMEYPCMAERGQDVSELVELLQDAQTRLQQSLATCKMNDMRRKAMACFYSKK